MFLQKCCVPMLQNEVKECSSKVLCPHVGTVSPCWNAGARWLFLNASQLMLSCDQKQVTKLLKWTIFKWQCELDDQHSNNGDDCNRSNQRR